jgi:hypothetical protein
MIIIRNSNDYNEQVITIPREKIVPEFYLLIYALHRDTIFLNNNTIARINMLTYIM